MIIKCKECGTSIEIDESQYEDGIETTTLCPLCGENVRFSITSEKKDLLPSIEETITTSFCQYCGTKMAKEHRFCPNCGHSCDVEESAQEESYEESGCYTTSNSMLAPTTPIAPSPPSITSSSIPPALGHQHMFSNVFSFSGRIRRLEYGLSYIIYEIWSIISVLICNPNTNGDGALILYYLLQIPGLWFLCAQGTKRCHDRGNSGWYQLIPFYGLIMLFGGGDYGYNKYGLDPKR